ncbi:SDR family NAD(P)-dependent oxidoreductase [Nocardia vaccinii]|uniref:SDR family NAD(P)-dependent oxidoreductase n=1 Tax=Nocardia vaccinii TaxID=1822 RepID=UPI000833C7B7|nr:SDR family NAD(P)-dependent oxidoreductase [Nocardia vaccinii]
MTEHRRLEGKVAIVSGSGGGIGRAHALLLAEQGAHVLVNDTGLRAGADAEKVAGEIIEQGGVAVANTMSATWATAEDIVQDAIDNFGRLDILVNNATDFRVGNMWDFTEEDWDATFDVNLKGYMAMIRAAVPHLAAQETSSIVNTASGSGFGHPGFVAYASAKEGVVGLTRTAAKELGRFGIRANAIRPVAAGNSMVDFNRIMQPWFPLLNLTFGPMPNDETYKLMEQYYPPRLVAPMVAWLCTDAARGITGRSFDVAGGHIWLIEEPGPGKYETAIEREGGWDLDGIDAVAPTELVPGLTNPYLLDGHPDLQIFPS